MNDEQRSRPNIEDEITGYYEKGGEIDRLTQGIGLLELARSKEIIGRYLPGGPAIVVDVGGGPGTYACWLAKAGYEVHLVDPIPFHVQTAEQTSNSQPDSPLSSITLGDARSLEFPNNFADIVLLFGPLYHLTTKEDRIVALREVHRILRPDGRLLAVAISRFATLNVGLQRDWLADPDFFRALKEEVASGQHRTPKNWPDLFTTAYFHLPIELQNEVVEAGLSLETILAVEGPGWISPNFGGQWQDLERRKNILSAIRWIEEETSLLGFSPHIIAVARKG